MTDSPIRPSVGRVVLFRTGTGSHETCGLVTRVHSQNCINIMVMFDGEGARPATSVNFDDNEIPLANPSWRWMPYQVAEAAKKQPADNEGASQS